MKKSVVAVGILTAALSLASGHDGVDHKKEAVENKRAIMKVVKKIAKAWGKADGKVFRKFYDSASTVRMIESGGQNNGVEDLVENHVLPEREHFKTMKVIINSVEVNLSEDQNSAWSISDIEFKAKTKDGKKIHSSGFETMIWAKKDGLWLILHSHSSMRKVRKKAQTDP